MCSCYDCLRQHGTTNPNRRDHRGRHRHPPDGRYTAKLTQPIIDPEDGTVLTHGEPTGEPGIWVGT